MHAAIQLAATMPPAPVSPYRLEKQAKGPPRRRYDKGVDTRDLEEEAASPPPLPRAVSQSRSVASGAEKLPITSLVEVYRTPRQHVATGTSAPTRPGRLSEALLMGQYGTSV
jgi:hypothetical protein